MVTYRGNSGHSHIADIGEIEVAICTLDEFEFDRVDLFKIDCEGYELQVLEGATKTLNRCTPTVLVEQKPGNGTRYGYGDRAALEFLQDLGARQVAAVSGDYVFVW